MAQMARRGSCEVSGIFGRKGRKEVMVDEGLSDSALYPFGRSLKLGRRRHLAS